MDNNKLEKLHQEMLEREREVYAKQATIKQLENEIQAGQQAYSYIRDQYMSIIESLVNTKRLNNSQLQKESAENPAITTVAKKINAATSIEEILLILEDNLPIATEYERLGIIHSLMRKGGATSTQVQELLLESYRQEVATIRVLNV